MKVFERCSNVKLIEISKRKHTSSPHAGDAEGDLDCFCDARMFFRFGCACCVRVSVD